MAGFEVVLKELKKFDEHRFCRAGWSEIKWIAAMPGLILQPATTEKPVPKVNERTARLIGESSSCYVQPYLVALTVDGRWLCGFTLSACDLLANDWQPFAE